MVTSFPFNGKKDNQYHYPQKKFSLKFSNHLFLPRKQYFCFEAELRMIIKVLNLMHYI